MKSPKVALSMYRKLDNEKATRLALGYAFKREAQLPEVFGPETSRLVQRLPCLEGSMSKITSQLLPRAAPADRREPRGGRLTHAPGGERRHFPRHSRVRRFVTVRLRVDGFFERISRRSLVPAPRVGHRRQPRLDLVQVPSSRRSCWFVRHRSPPRLRGCKVRRFVRVYALHGPGDDAW